MRTHLCHTCDRLLQFLSLAGFHACTAPHLIHQHSHCAIILFYWKLAELIHIIHLQFLLHCFHFHPHHEGVELLFPPVVMPLFDQ